jgi:hypothetical protein
VYYEPRVVCSSHEEGFLHHILHLVPSFMRKTHFLAADN